MTSYQKNRTIVFNAQIKKLENYKPSYKRKPFQVISAGLAFSFNGPHYRGGNFMRHNSPSIMERLDVGYPFLVLCFFIGFAVFVFGVHLVELQLNKKEIRSLKKKLEIIEQDVKYNRETKPFKKKKAWLI